jgi:hypothetical protein
VHTRPIVPFEYDPYVKRYASIIRRYTPLNLITRRQVLAPIVELGRASE